MGIRELDDKVWLVSFMECDLGCFDRDEDRWSPASILSLGHSVNHVSGMRCKPCDRNTPRESGGPCRTRTYDLLIKSQQLYQLS